MPGVPFEWVRLQKLRGVRCQHEENFRGQLEEIKRRTYRMLTSATVPELVMR